MLFSCKLTFPYGKRTLEFEKLFKDNKKLSEEVTFLERELEKYRSAENEIGKTMRQAQQLMTDISASAEKRAEIIVSNAELEADATMHEARERVQRLEEENKNLHDRYISFRNRYKKMLEDELFRFESVQDDLFPDFNENKLEEILAGDLFTESGDAGAEDSDRTAAVSSRSTAVIGTKIKNETSLFAGTDDGRRTVIMNTNGSEPDDSIDDVGEI
jgi:cell division initiation protein